MRHEFERYVKRIVESVLIEYTTLFHEIKYFHPSGTGMPNGCHYQRGGFLNECRINKNNFVLDEGVHGEQYGMKNYRGGIIVFSTDINAVQLDGNKLLNKIRQLVATFNNRFNRGKKIHKAINKFNDIVADSEEGIGAYSVGNFFKGKYVGDNGEMYSEKSLAIEINGLSSRNLLSFAELIAREFMQETVLVKDLNMNKVYLADDIPLSSNTTLEKELLNVNVKC